MAVYRQIQVSFWQDGDILDFDPEEKYFYIYLMTNSKTTQCGIYELPKKVMMIELGYSMETVSELLQRFIDKRKILYSEDTKEIFLLNWLKHNSIKSPKVMSCVEKELKSVKHKDFLRTFRNSCIQYRYPMPTVCKDYGEEEEKEEKKEEEKEEEKEEKVIALSSDPTEILKNEIHELTNTCNIKKLTLHDLDRLFSYIGLVDKEVIEAAIKKGEGKHVNYALTILDDMYKEGIFKKEHLFQKSAPGKLNIKTDTLPTYENEKIIKLTEEQEKARDESIKQKLIALGEWNEDEN